MEGHFIEAVAQVFSSESAYVGGKSKCLEVGH